MPLLTPPLTDARDLLRAADDHLDDCPDSRIDLPENRLQRLAQQDARATVHDIDEHERETRDIVGRTLSDLAALYLLLGAHPDCRSCARLRRDADRIHHHLGLEI